MNIIALIGSVASIIGAIISIIQSKQAKKAKEASIAAQEATEKVRDKISLNIQYESLVIFKNECDKFCRFLQNASIGRNAQGKKPNYVENELESFLTLFNTTISNTLAQDRERLEDTYELLKSKRESLSLDNKILIQNLLDDVRILSRLVGGIINSYKLSS